MCHTPRPTAHRIICIGLLFAETLTWRWIKPNILLYWHYFAKIFAHADKSRGSKVFIRVCLCVCPQHNSKTNDPKVFKLGTVQRMILGYPKSIMALGLKGQKVKVMESQSAKTIQSSGRREFALCRLLSVHRPVSITKVLFNSIIILLNF